MRVVCPGSRLKCECTAPLQGQARFQLYQKLAALGFAVVQSVGQLTYIRPFVNDFSTEWLVINSLTLVAGSMILVWVRILPCRNLPCNILPCCNLPCSILPCRSLLCGSDQLQLERG